METPAAVTELVDTLGDLISAAIDAKANPDSINDTRRVIDAADALGEQITTLLAATSVSAQILSKESRK